MAHSGSFCRGELKNSNLHNGHTAHITSLRNIVQQRYIIIRIEIYSMSLDSNYKQLVFVFSDSLFFFFFWLQPHYLTKPIVNNAFMHCLRTHKFYFSVIFSLKMSPTVLFTRLKIILLFQFQFSVFSFQLYPNVRVWI